MRSLEGDHRSLRLVIEAEEMYERHMKWNRWMLQAVGIWPKQSHWTNFSSLMYEVNAYGNIAWLIILTMTQYFSIRDAGDDMFEIIEVISATTTSSLIIHKALTMLFKRSVVQEIDQVIRELWIEGWCRHSDKVRQKMLRVAGILKILTLIYLIPITLTTLNFSISPIVAFNQQKASNVSQEDGNYVLPYLVQFPGVDITDPKNYAVCYATTCIVSVSIIFYVTGVDTFYVAYISQICLQFDLLALEFNSSIDETDTSLFSKVEILARQKSRFNKSVEKHLRLIRMCELMEGLFSQIVLGMCVVSTVSICAVMFQALVNTQHGNALLFTLYLIFEIIEVFIYCWYGNALIDKSSLLCQALYFMKWYNLDMDLAKDLMTVMTRAQRPIYMSAYGFAVVSLELCTTILSTAASYYTLLRKMYYR